VCALSVLAADKSGVGPNVISLPKGPGSIEGLGESFQPSLNTGTAKYGLSFKLPPGTAGNAPSLGLNYEGGGGNGPVGFGWTLPMSHIQRRTDEGIPTYGANVGITRPEVFINEGREELVPLADGFAFCRNEGSFVRYQQLSNHWEAVSPDGTLMAFGLTDEGRIHDNAATNHIFSWLLQRVTDTHGNVIVYAYTNFPGPENLNQRYLSAIQYGPGAPPWDNFHFVAFTYEDRPDWFEDCRSGFVIRTGKRLKTIVIATQGPTLTNHLSGDFNGDGLVDYLNRKYVLDYSFYAGTNSHWSLLSGVTLVGADGSSTLPPATFGYQVSDPPGTLSASGQLIGGTNEPPLVMDNTSVDFLDLNADGLPDLLRTDPGGGGHTAYLNRGEATGLDGPAIRWDNAIGVDSADGQAWLYNLQSTAPIAHLADMDGDGLADLTVTALDGSVRYFPNTGSQGWGVRRDMAVLDTAPPSPFGNSTVRTADIDFDKRIDIIQSLSSGNGADYRIWFNLGNQDYAASVTVPQGAGFLFSDSGVQIADFNGDRVPDIARVQSAQVTVTAGLGYGHFTDPVNVPIPDVVLDENQTARAALTDLNGDGLADLVLERAAPGELWYWLNLGNYQFSPRKTLTGLPTTFSGTTVIRWADLNGNGTTDLVYADSSAEPRLQTVDVGLLLNGGLAPNVLVAISNGIGRVTLIQYQPSTVYALEDARVGQPWPDLMPNPVQVVASVTTLDSLGHQYVTGFRYHNGYYDPAEKQFRGFGRAEQIDMGDSTAPTLVTRSWFDTGRTHEPMKGRLLGTSIEQEDGNVFSTETNFWSTPPLTLHTGTNGTNVVYVHPTGKTILLSELGQGTPRRLESDFAYDRFGNETTNANYGIVENGDRTAFDDERVIVTTYALNTNAWIVRLPARQEVQDENGVVTSRTENFYDDETFAGDNFGQVTLGNLTLMRAWIDPASPTNYIKASRSKYDPFGNAVVQLDPLAVAPGGTPDLSQGHARGITYDNRFHSYPVAETIHIGAGSAPLVAEAEYDEGLAVLNTWLDFSSNATTYGYDTFGRLVHIVKPLDTPAYPTLEFDYALAVPFSSTGRVNYIETRQLDRTPGTAGAKRNHYLIARQFVDGLGRNLGSRQEAEPAPGTTQPRVVVGGAVTFNQRLNTARVLNPHFSLAAGATLDGLLDFESVEAPGWQGSFEVEGNLVPLNLASAHQTATEYDATLRPVKITNPDGTFSRTVYEPLVVRSFDENDTDPVSPFHDTPSVRFQDGLGRAIRTDETTRLNDDGTPSGALHTWTTQYKFDLNDRLTRITDSQNNVKTMLYDGLKRRTFMNDLDRGILTYVFDEASNLKETVDAKGQRIGYTYDGANRILTEDYHDEGLPFSGDFAYDPDQPVSRANRPDVAFFYDTPESNLPLGDGTTATAANTRGNLAYVWDLSGEEHSAYDARGRVAWTVKRVPDPQRDLGTQIRTPSSLASYTTRFDRDSMDRVTRMIYPDNDEVRYEYNDRNLLSRIVGGPSGSILTNFVYAPSGQQQQMDYGNGVRTTYAHDNRQRLKKLLTISRPSTLNLQLVHFGYVFDGVSNLKIIEDLRPTAAVPTTDPRRNSQNFAYDDLYRLTQVQYPNTPTNFINYRYDRIGNLLAQTSDLIQTERGFPVADLGTLAYGGSAGPLGRMGRSASDPPGPHALTSVTASSTNSPQPRVYDYDANGNMINVDGLNCTWDFKDRLVSVEDDSMRAEYTYDYTDRRILKRVFLKKKLTEHHSMSIIYLSRQFEVRDHDQPVKYVFNGATRVASVIGSLSDRPRLQRLRLWPGWNLCSLAVTATNAVAQLNASSAAGTGGVVLAAYHWNPSNVKYDSVSPGQTVAAGSVLWIHASTNSSVAVTGEYVAPTDRTFDAGGAFLPGAGLEAWNIRSLLDTQAVSTAWTFAADHQNWQARVPPVPELGNHLPEFLAPGEALLVNADAPFAQEAPKAVLQVRYYHHDHLGSSSVITDADGALVEETAFFPFGHPRNSFQPRALHEPYGFTQKERDPESGLHYFEARFLAGAMARFVSPDPKYANLDGMSAAEYQSFLATPQKGGLYAYCLNNPLKYSDPTGLDENDLDAVGSANDVAGIGFGLVEKAGGGLEIVGKVGGHAGGALDVTLSVVSAIDDPSAKNITKIGWSGTKWVAGVTSFGAGLFVYGAEQFYSWADGKAKRAEAARDKAIAEANEAMQNAGRVGAEAKERLKVVEQRLDAIGGILAEEVFKLTPRHSRTEPGKLPPMTAHDYWTEPQKSEEALIQETAKSFNETLNQRSYQ